MNQKQTKVRVSDNELYAFRLAAMAMSNTIDPEQRIELQGIEKNAMATGSLTRPEAKVVVNLIRQHIKAAEDQYAEIEAALKNEPQISMKHYLMGIEAAKKAAESLTSKVDNNDYKIKYSLMVNGNEHPKEWVSRNKKNSEDAVNELKEKIAQSGDECQLVVNTIDVL